MKQVDDSIIDSPFNGKSAMEILEHFKDYKFKDVLGHSLELCQNFIDLIKAG
ncbi:hypothetical protein [Lonsdalea quercina]|uniref:hypothetical protein n=1 Tax=Lonsdalea quercina TaxID=71657 RepID=UPI001C654FE9|nr:hypothetical protein [Lonsdalea quercina]